MRTRKLIILLLLLTIAPMPALSVNKCIDPATGKVSYQNAPCPAGAQGDTVEIKNAPELTSGSGLRESELKMLEQAQQQREAAAQKPPASGKGETSKECFDMRRHIMSVEERENRGIHGIIKGSEEESVWRKREYEALCGSW